VLVEEMWQLPRGEFDQLLATHLALHPQTRAGLERVRELLPTLPSSVYRREEEVVGFLSGPVDWPRTLQRRVATADPTLFVCRPASRRYDTPPARLIHWVLTQVSALAGASGLGDEGTTGQAVHATSDAARRLLLHPKLGSIRRPVLAPEEKLRAIETRKPPFEPVTGLARVLRDAWTNRDRDVVSAVVLEQLLAPAADDVLFELQVGFDLVDALVARGFERQDVQQLLTTGKPKVPFARLGSSLHGIVEIWWQRALWGLEGMPQSKGKLRQILGDAQMRQQSFRPDFIVHLLDARRPVLFEVKLTSTLESANEREGILEALAYLNDAEEPLKSLPLPKAAVIAWNATGRPAASLVSVADQLSVPSVVDLILGNTL
jgi:hypothetical protein